MDRYSRRLPPRGRARRLAGGISHTERMTNRKNLTGCFFASHLIITERLAEQPGANGSARRAAPRNRRGIRRAEGTWGRTGWSRFVPDLCNKSGGGRWPQRRGINVLGSWFFSSGCWCCRDLSLLGLFAVCPGLPVIAATPLLSTPLIRSVFGSYPRNEHRTACRKAPQSRAEQTLVAPRRLR